MFTHPISILPHPKVVCNVKLGLAVQGNGDMWQMELWTSWGGPWSWEMAVAGGGGSGCHLLLGKHRGCGESPRALWEDLCQLSDAGKQDGWLGIIWECSRPLR